MLSSWLRKLAQGGAPRPSPARKAPRARRWQLSLEELASGLVPTFSVNIQGASSPPSATAPPTPSRSTPSAPVS
jgi:hypothetical protein